MARQRRRYFRNVALFLGGIATALGIESLTGCAGVGYLLQAGRGQMALIHHARPIPVVIADERTPPKIRELLSEIPSIKKFGEGRGLKATANYQEYVKLDRSHAVYVVSACETLRFSEKRWGFPLVGSFPYLGWFDRGNAENYAQGLRAEGWDVDVRGAAAFSTLGWFRDAVLSTMISDGQESLGDLINVVLHESVHATVYVNGQADFNESLASFVADRMTLEYFDQVKGAGSEQKQAYVRAESAGKERVERFHVTYEKLKAVYASEMSDSEKLAEKSRILGELKSELQLKREINNATLAQFKTYRSGGPEFEGLWSRCENSWPRFMKAVGRLESQDFASGSSDQALAAALSRIEREGC